MTPRPKAQAPVKEHPRCRSCGWTLYQTFTKSLVCLHNTCELRRQAQD